MPNKEGLLERLAKGAVIGDGGMCWTLEKRGYCKVGPWSPEAVVEHPEAVKNLHREFLRAGVDVIQTATFYSDDAKLSFGAKDKKVMFTCKQLNNAACKLATEVAAEGDALVCGSISPLLSFSIGKPVDEVKVEFMKQIDVFREHKVDFVLGEFFINVAEAEIAASVMKTLGIPVGITMRLGPIGDQNGVSVEECALRMARTGVDMIGTNCKFDPYTQLEVMERMKRALDADNLSPYLIWQPYGFFCPDADNELHGSSALPDAPLCLESRQLTRIDVHKVARAAWEAGIRYIGGCCGMESYHIRSIALELTSERGGKLPPCHDYCEPFGGQMLRDHSYVHGSRTTREYWYNVNAASGRPYNAPLNKPLYTTYDFNKAK